MIEEKINIYKNPEMLSVAFTEFLQKMLSVYPHINLSLSGGSTPKVIFDYWAENCKESIDWNRISFYWGDERCVPPENDMNNFGMTKEHLFDKVSNISKKSILRMHGENEPEEEAQWYSKILSTKLLKSGETPYFEVIMLGLGDDGHTVSIFPHQIDLWNNEQLCIVTEHPESKMKRVTITGKVVNSSQHVVFLAMGKNKSEKVRDIIKNRELFKTKYPAALVNPKKGYLHWFLDEDAASLL